MTVRPSLLLIACAACATTLAAQTQNPSQNGNGAAANSVTLSRDAIISLAKTQVAINVAHDSSNAQMAKAGNKKDESQKQLQESFRTAVDELLHHAGLTDKEFRRQTYLVSIDTASRRIYDSVVMVLTGAPLPGVAANTKLTVPPGPAGVHIGHVVNTFAEAPNLLGLLPAAIAEARIAQQHATLATRQPDNLAYMKTHAGHVIHALDPKSIALNAPGLGYGVKKAADGCAAHIEMAAAAEGSTPAIQVHAKHIAMSCRNTIVRADALIELAKQVIAATDAPTAAKIISQMVSLADQLYAGQDFNNDGRITWEEKEGGLQAAEEHVKLMLGVR